MKVGLMAFGIIAILFGGFVFNNAKSAVHEIEALICGVIFAVSFGSAAIVTAIEKKSEG